MKFYHKSKYDLGKAWSPEYEPTTAWGGSMSQHLNHGVSSPTLVRPYPHEYKSIKKYRTAAKGVELSLVKQQQ